MLFLRLAVLLWNSAPVLRLSVGEGWRRKYISPEDQYLPDGEMWFSLVPKSLKLSSFPTLVLPIGRASFATTARKGACALTYLYCGYPGRGHTTYAPVLHISVYEGFGEPHLPIRWVLTIRGNIISQLMRAVPHCKTSLLSWQKMHLLKHVVFSSLGGFSRSCHPHHHPSSLQLT